MWKKSLKRYYTRKINKNKIFISIGNFFRFLKFIHSEVLQTDL